MAKIYNVDFQKRELVGTKSTERPLLRKVATVISKLALVEHKTLEDRHQLIDDAIRLNIAAYEIRKEYVRPLSGVQVDEVDVVQKEASEAMKRLSDQERRGAWDQVLELTRENLTITEEV